MSQVSSPMSNPLLSIVILNHNTQNLLEDCLKSLFKYSKGISLQIIVVDNASTDGSVAMITANFPTVQLLQNSTNLLYSAANNQGLQIARGTYTLFLNSDTILHPHTLAKMVKFMENHPRCAAACCKQLNQKTIVLPTCHQFSTPITEILELPISRKLFPHPALLAKFRYQSWDRLSTRQTDTLPGSFLFTKTSIIQKIHGFDPHLRLFYNDADLCKRLKQLGYNLYYYAAASITHLSAQTLNQYPLPKVMAQSYQDMAYYYKKHHGVLWFIVLKLLSSFNLLYFRSSSIHHHSQTAPSLFTDTKL